MTSDSINIDLVPPHRRRKDGTPLTPTCTIPLKVCACLAGDDCDCLDMGDDVFAEPVFWDLRPAVNA